MSLGGRLWRLRRRVLGPERVVTTDQVAQLLRSSVLGRRARLRLGALLVRELLFGPPRRARIHVRGAVVELGGGNDFPVDWKAFFEIFAGEPYRADYREARVLDIGGHKGYFGAYALAHGAASVLTFEPAERNYRVLERTAKPLRARWSVHKAALGSNTGTGVLLLDKTSWAHSLVSVERPAGEQRVRIETLEHALSELSNRGARTIVKVDAEGSECEILARPGTLENVDLVMVEWHPETAPCTTDDLARVAASAGLVRGVDRGVLRFERR